MYGLPAIDIVVIVLYFSGMIAIGVWASRRISNQEDFFLGGRRFGKLIQTFAAFGQGTSADTAVSVSTTTFTNGASGIWSSLLYLFGTPIYWLVAPWMRRLRLLTMGDFFRERYGSQRMAAMYAIIATLGMMGFIAVGFSAMAKTVVAILPKEPTALTSEQIETYNVAYEHEKTRAARVGGQPHLLSFAEWTERARLESVAADQRTNDQQQRLAVLSERRPALTFSHIPEWVLVCVVCIIVMLYAIAGGLEAAFITDMIQGMFIIVLSILLIPFGWSKISEMHGGSGLFDAPRIIHERLPSAYFEVFGSPHAIDFLWYYIIAISVLAMLVVPIQPNFLVANGAAKNEYAARYGFTVGNFMKRGCTVMWGVFGLAAIVLYSGQVHHSDLVWGYATRDLLGSLGIGLVGLMIACLMAALMSTVDCLMLTCSSLLTHNLYAFLVPNRSQGHYVWVGRAMGALVVIGGAWVALQFDTILQILKFIWEVLAGLIPAFWLGMKWRRAHRWGAWASIILGGTAFLVVPFLGPVAAPGLRQSPRLLETTHPEPLTRSYAAGKADIVLRESEIEAWDRLATEDRAIGPRPEPLKMGDTFEVVYRLPQKSIYWAQGIAPDDDGEPVGRGSLNVELYLIDEYVHDLSKLPYAFNETLRILIRLIVPVVIMVAVSLCCRPDRSTAIDRFFIKMRVKVQPTPEADERALEVAYADPDSTRHRLLLPNSSWELLRWQREDLVGFVAAIGGVVGILLMMRALVGIGG